MGIVVGEILASVLAAAGIGANVEASAEIVVSVEAEAELNAGCDRWEN